MLVLMRNMRQFGYEPLELIGSSFLKVIPGDSIQKTEETYFELIKNVGMEIELGVTRVRKDGTMLFCLQLIV